MATFVRRASDGERGNDGTGPKASSRAAPPVRPALWRVVRMAAAVAALPVRWLWKNQLAPGNVAPTMISDDNNEMST